MFEQFTHKPYIEASESYSINVIITHDNESWRKEIEPHKPYYVSDGKLIGYKEQRY